ncbi:MAG: branched-chain-amino-acid transaminase [Peptococcaceae bacterium]|jgi:branched-chain amino acid aminotransferase|nr:MAG: branched-chain-amino-acid transaminase [Peptococcaceae bacterium]
MSAFVYLNGDYVPAEDAKVSVFDHGFLYGDGVFETMRAYVGRVFMLTEHLERLYRSAAIISLVIPYRIEELAAAVEGTIQRNNLPGAYIRLSVSRGAGPLGIDPLNCAGPTVVCTARALAGHPEVLYSRGVQAVTVCTRRIPVEALDPSAKTFNFLNNIMAKIEANAAGAYEGIMLNSSGQVAEGTVSNLFLLRRGVLLTPAPEAGILPGITRNTVLELAGGMGIRAVETLFGPGELYAAEEMFLTNSSWELLPVVTVDGFPVGSGRPGPVTGLLLDAYRKLVAESLDLTNKK